MTREDARLYVFGGVLAAFLMSWGLASLGISKNVDDQRRACEAANHSRQSELFQRETLVLNAKARIADDPDAEEPREALRRARESKRRLIHGVADQAEPGSVRRDCRVAYTKPPPWGWLE